MTGITSKQRIMNAVELKQPLDRLPVLPYMREPAIKYVGSTFSECLEDAGKYVEGQVKIRDLLDLDGVWDMIAVPAVEIAMGCPVYHPHDQAPSILPLIDNPGDVRKLKIPGMNDRNISHRISIVRELRRRVGPDIPVIAWVSMPFRAAAMLRGADRLFKDMFTTPDLVNELMKIASEAYLEYAKEMLKAGADVIHISEPVGSGSCISRKHYEKYAFPAAKKMVDQLRRLGAKTILFHFCGDVNDRLDLAAELCDILYVDSSFRGVTPGYLRETLGNRLCLMGGPDVNTALLFGSPETIQKETFEYLDSVGTRGFILSGSCMMPRDVPVENLQAFAGAASAYMRKTS